MLKFLFTFLSFTSSKSYTNVFLFLWLFYCCHSPHWLLVYRFFWCLDVCSALWIWCDDLVLQCSHPHLNIWKQLKRAKGREVILFKGVALTFIHCVKPITNPNLASIHTLALIRTPEMMFCLMNIKMEFNKFEDISQKFKLHFLRNQNVSETRSPIFGMLWTTRNKADMRVWVVKKQIKK